MYTRPIRFFFIGCFQMFYGFMTGTLGCKNKMTYTHFEYYLNGEGRKYFFKGSISQMNQFGTVVRGAVYQNRQTVTILQPTFCCVGNYCYKIKQSWVFLLFIQIHYSLDAWFLGPFPIVFILSIINRDF